MQSCAQSPARPVDAGRPVVILGVPFDRMTLAAAVDRIESMVAEGGFHYVVTPNVDFLVKARRDAELHRILVNADLVLCDGKPLVWASRWLGDPLPGRVAGSDLMPCLLQRATERGWRIFLLGGSPDVAAEAARRIASAHPSLPEVAHYSPPFRRLDEMNNDEIVDRLRAARPDIVLVCFGCPKQEKWISRHGAMLKVPVMIGAGATIDFLAGTMARAPAWMRRSGTEWLFRLIQEPRRLAGRYADDLLSFAPAIVAQRFRRGPSGPRASLKGRP
ncbi:MAG TPA: WecB/TagA/CpsF family glycosyltransferase [Bryobacteraceae bacterium]|nr:WecB/TagA/CpsF family glycosyltransferase [Bryobacteraceae bacterium]